MVIKEEGDVSLSKSRDKKVQDRAACIEALGRKNRGWSKALKTTGHTYTIDPVNLLLSTGTSIQRSVVTEIGRESKTGRGGRWWVHAHM